MKNKRILASLLAISLVSAMVGCGKVDDSSVPEKPVSEQNSGVAPFTIPDETPDSFPDADTTLVTDEELTEEKVKEIGDKYIGLLHDNNYKAIYDYTDQCLFEGFYPDSYTKQDFNAEDISFVGVTHFEKDTADNYNKIIAGSYSDTSQEVSDVWSIDYTNTKIEQPINFVILKFKDGWRVDEVLRHQGFFTEEDRKMLENETNDDIDGREDSEEESTVITSEEGEDDNE